MMMSGESEQTQRGAPPVQPLPSKAETVLIAAGRVFLTHGFSAATTDMIQREAGVSKSTVYAYYPNKEALFVAVIEKHCARLAAVLDDVASETGGLRQALTAVGRAYLTTVVSADGLALFRTVVAEAPRFPHLARTFYQAGTRVVMARILEHLTQAAAEGEVDLTTIGLETATLIFAGLIRSEPQLHYLIHPDARPSAEQVEQWVSIAVGTFLRAYGRKAEE